MKTHASFGLAVLMVAVLALAAPNLALAAGADTNYGTTITNSVTIQYGSGPSTITTSTSVNFVVDRILDWTIAPSTAATVGVFPGSAGNAIAFSVQNATNGTVDLLLSYTATADAPSTVVLYIDNGDGSFGAGDTALPGGAGGFYLDEVGEDAAPTVFIVVDVPASATTVNVYSYEISSEPRVGGAAGLGAALPDDSGNIEDAAQIQNVYNDGAGYNDAVRDLNYTAYAAFQVVVPSLAVTKAAEVTSDGLGNVAPFAKAIPGATVHYTISVVNNGTAAATAVNVTDNIPAGTTYLGGLALTNGGGGSESYNPGPPAQVVVTGATIPTGVTMTLEFNVTID